MAIARSGSREPSLLLSIGHACRSGVNPPMGRMEELQLRKKEQVACTFSRWASGRPRRKEMGCCSEARASSSRTATRRRWRGRASRDLRWPARSSEEASRRGGSGNKRKVSLFLFLLLLLLHGIHIASFSRLQGSATRSPPLTCMLSNVVGLLGANTGVAGISGPWSFQMGENCASSLEKALRKGGRDGDRD